MRPLKDATLMYYRSVESRYQLERYAWKQLDKLLDSADECLNSFRAAGVQPPPPLKRLLGLEETNEADGSGGNGNAQPPSAPRKRGRPRKDQNQPPKPGKYRYSPAPEPPTKPYHGEPPKGAERWWPSILAASAGTYAVALAVLREHPEEFISAATLNRRMEVIRKVEGGAGYSVLDRLRKDGIVDGDISNLRILKRQLGGILSRDAKWIWAPKENLSEYDLARHRREAVIRLLREHGGSLAIASITKGLQASDWVQSDKTDDLVKADLRYLAKDGIVRKLAETREWEYVSGGKDRYTAEERRPDTAV